MSHREYDTETALVVVDLQNDFADPSGSLYVNEGEVVVEQAGREVAQASAAGALVVYTKDWHPAATPHFQTGGGPWPVHCVMGTWGAELHPSLPVVGEIVTKGSGGEDGYSGFAVRDQVSGEKAPTALGALLERRGTERVVVIGLATDYCVKETALDALSLGYDTTVLEGIARPVDLEAGDGTAALEAVRAAGGRVE